MDLVLVAPETKNNYNIQVGGGQEGGWDLTIDGISATPAAPFEQRLWTTINSPSVDAIQEFSVDTNGFKAEFGHAGGGLFSFVSKSGTNQFHGNAYEFLRNNALDANTYFNNALRLPRAVLKQNDFGATFGGPVWIPKIYNGKDKTFFFTSWEAYRDRRGAPTRFYTVPLPEMYQGDFSNWRDKTGKVIPIYDPATTRSDGEGGFIRDQFVGNKIPAARFSTVAKNVLPLATMRPNAADPSGLSPNPRNNYLTTTGATTFPWDKFSQKVDHLITQNNRVGFLFQTNQTDQLISGSAPPGLPEPLNQDFQFGHTYTKVYRVTYDWSISPTILNHLSAGFNDWGQFRGADDSQRDKGWGTKLGIKNVPDPDLLFPGFRFDDYSPWGRSEFGGSYNKTWALADDITLSRGAHSLKAGFTFQEDHYNGYGEHTASGSFSFSRQGTGIPGDQGQGSGNAFASFLLGDVSSGSIETKRIVSDQWKYYAAYFQDDWRVNKRLTLNLGIRWEFTPPTVEGRFPDGYSNFNPTLPNPGAGGRLGALEYAGNGPGRTGRRSLYDAWPYGFGPRFGVAYSLNDKTIIRAGAARSFGSVKNTGGSSHFQGFIGSTSYGSTNGNVTPAFNIDNGFPDWPRPPFLVPTFLNGTGANFWQSYDAGRLPEYYNFSLNIQRQLRGNMVVEAGYSGSMGHHLATNLVNLNQMDPKVFYGYVNRLGFDNAYNLMNKDINSPEARAAGVPFPYVGFKGNVGQSLRPYPQYQGINTGGDGGDRSGNSTYHALVVKWEKRYSSGLTFLNSYVFSKFFTDAERLNASSNGAMDQYNRRLEKSLSGNDQTHNFKFSYSYELPLGKGKQFLSQGILGQVIGGWRIAGISTYASGTPVAIYPGYGLPLYANSSNRVTILDYNGWRAKTATGKFDPFKDRWYDPALFSATPVLAGNAPASGYKGIVLKDKFGVSTVRNPKERYPWGFNESVSLARTFRFTERLSIELRGEAFNVFNRVQWQGPNTDISSNDFGRVFGQNNSPRQMQLAAKIEF